MMSSVLFAKKMLNLNEVVFKGAIFDPIQLCFIIKTRVAWWVKAKFPSSFFFSLDAIVADICLSDLAGSMELTPVVPAVWKPPHVGWLKFNVDGAARGDGLLGGIRGILKNEFGVLLLSGGGWPSCATRGARYFLLHLVIFQI
ncbi:hypothetical protein GQ457_16G006730 [Hibiscus cannabinus]